MQRLLCLLAVVAAAAAAVPGPNGKPDPVNDLIASLVDGAKGAPASAPLSHSVTVALDNANQVNKEGPDSNDQKRAEMSREAATKKGYENTQKADTEQTHKIRSEARQKKMDLEIRISKAEAKNKEFDANMQLKEEQRSKKAAEEQRKTQEAERKDIERSNANAAAARRQVERSFELQKATAAAAEATLKAKEHSARQMAQEGVQKEEAKAARKRERDAQLFRKEVADKKVAEKVEKHRQGIIAKKKAEEAGKQETRMREEKAKQLTAQAEQEAKKRKREATGKWCECSNQRVHFDRNNEWQSCPSDSLLVGMYRGAFHNMANIYYYRCCKPCREHGTQPLTVSGCMTANWVTSFDSQGWSMCPANHFIQGLYKSSCNWIYCLEYARCCKLSESRGSSDCKPQQKWATSFDAAGWSVVNDNRFIQGFYRSGGHFLYNIEYPQQCKYFAHNPSA